MLPSSLKGGNDNADEKPKGSDGCRVCADCDCAFGHCGISRSTTHEGCNEDCIQQGQNQRKQHQRINELNVSLEPVRFRTGSKKHSFFLRVKKMRLKNQKGQTGIEYALICIVLLAIVTTAVAQPLKDALTVAFQRVKNDVAAPAT